MSNPDSPSPSGTTSTPTNGSNKAILIPILAAFLIIALMVYFGSESPKFSQSLREFTPHEGRFYRVEGTVHDAQLQGQYRILRLCSGELCIDASISPEQSIQPEDAVIVEGVWRSNRLMVSKVLKRCDGHPQH